MTQPVEWSGVVWSVVCTDTADTESSAVRQLRKYLTEWLPVVGTQIIDLEL